VAPAPDAPTVDHPEPRWTRLREAAVLVAVALTLNLAGNGRTSLWDRDEPRYATCVREMRASGNLIQPTYNGEPRYQKPVLIYWLMLAGTALAGDNPFGARLVSALAGTASCLLAWILARRMLGRRPAFLAGLMLATAPLMVAESKLATTDATLAFFILVCQAALWELGRAAPPLDKVVVRTRLISAAVPRSLIAAIFWTALALATLTKGPVAPAWIATAALASWWWGGPSACWRRLEWRRGLTLFAILTLPWYLAIGILSRGAFYREAIGFQIIERMVTGLEEHVGFPGFYVVTSLLTLHPWSALLPAALLAAWFKRRSDPALGFLLGWVVGPLVLLECMRTKLVHYYLPAAPACAMLAAWLVERLSEAEVNLRRWPLGRISLGLLTGIGIGLTVALLAGVMVVPWPLRWPALVLAIVIGAGTLLAMERFQTGRTRLAAQGLVITWGLVLLLFGAWLLPAAEPYRISRKVGERLKVLAVRERAAPMLGIFAEPGVVYTLGRPAPHMQNLASFYARVRREGAVVLALMANELESFRKDPRGLVEACEVVEGFNIDKGRTERLHLVVVRPVGLARRETRTMARER
jgi:4-amino-4-deoxy-L-arabinose transferase-like glycosyltransferase